MDTMPRVSIIILNWNGWRDTVECLESVFQMTYPDYNVIVVDNRSEDDSIQKIKEYASGEIIPISPFFSYRRENKPIDYIEYTIDEAEDSSVNLMFHETTRNKKLILIKNERNAGFSGGNNIAIRYALKNLEPDFFLLLNNDTVVHPEFLSELVKGASYDEKIAITCPKCYYYNYEGRTDITWFAGGEIDLWWYPFYRHIGIGQIDQLSDGINDCDWVTGAAMMLSKTAPIKFLDEQFFFGREDVDICIKTKSQGYRITVNYNAIIWHKVGSSSKKAYPNRIKSVHREYKEIIRMLANYNPLYLLWVPILTIIFLFRAVHFFTKRILNTQRNASDS